MKLVRSSLLVLTFAFAAPALADCGCAANACKKDKDGVMACGEGKKCDCAGESKACRCKDGTTKKETKKKG